MGRPDDGTRGLEAVDGLQPRGSRHKHPEFGAALVRYLSERGKSQRWLGREVARIEGRDRPYTQTGVAGWVNSAAPSPSTVFAIERALLLSPGSLSRLLGYVPASARPAQSVPDAIRADGRLSVTAQRALIAAYEQLVDHGADGS